MIEGHQKHMNNLSTSAISFVFLTSFITSCATQTEKVSPPVVTQIDPVQVEPVIETTKPTPVLVQTKQIAPMPPTNQATIYFNFDSSNVNEDAKSIISKHVKFLKNNPEFSVTVEGHADSYGADEYNSILGRMRAEAIKEIMISENVSENKIRLISYGEKKPAIDGDSESARQLNRRAIFVYNDINQ